MIFVYPVFRYHKELKSYEEYADELDFLERHLDVTDYDIVLCHNDFWPPNCLYQKDEGNVFNVKYYKINLKKEYFAYIFFK